MAAVKQVGSEKRRLTEGMARQIEREVAETNMVVSERNKRNKSRGRRRRKTAGTG